MKNTTVFDKTPKERSLAASSKRQSKPHPRRPRIRCWHADDYQELFIYISPNQSGAVWVIKDQGIVRERNLVFAKDSKTAFDAACVAARGWCRENAPGARLRFRSSIERAALFTKSQVMERGRRLAA